jgi:hypothetical protein
MTTEKDVAPPQTIKTKSTSDRNIFSKTNAAPGSTISFVTSNQLLRTRKSEKESTGMNNVITKSAHDVYHVIS